MFILKVTEKRKKQTKIFTFTNTDQIKNFIKNILTRDLYIKKYVFDYDEDLEYFLKNNYNKKFFIVTNKWIYLNILPNGLHRELKMNTKTFNNRTLKRLIGKVLYETGTVMEDKFLHFDSSRYHFMEFIKTTDDPEKYSSISVIFDKLNWEYQFVKLVLFDEQFSNELKRKLNEYTVPLRIYRKKQKNEDYTER
jgi:hypothetical protein